MSEQPLLVELLENGELPGRVEMLEALLSPCRLCPRACGADRLAGERGLCGAGLLPSLSSVCDHHGEEPVLSGSRGAGTVFFGGCNLRCVYCQNHTISQAPDLSPGEIRPEELADQLLDLQRRGCHNVEFVSPSHYVPQMARALLIAAQRGLRLPVVYNSNGYDGLAALRLLEGIVDIYLPDLKYGEDAPAERYSGVRAYVHHSQAALREMQRQVGRLLVDDEGIAYRGLIVRHLVLPHDLSGTRRCLHFLAEEISPRVTLSLMAQYFPTHQATDHAPLARPLTAAEYEQALAWLEEAGLEEGWVQELAAQESYRPDFDRDHPFEG